MLADTMSPHNIARKKKMGQNDHFTKFYDQVELLSNLSDKVAWGPGIRTQPLITSGPHHFFATYLAKGFTFFNLSFFHLENGHDIIVRTELLSGGNDVIHIKHLAWSLLQKA